jgi:rhodanese-related sulfurtransferase
MTVTRVSPREAKKLIDDDGYAYVDVRSIPEFEAGHPAGAYNVPIAHLGPMGMSPNASFLSVMQKHFANDAKLVVGCQSGGRSYHAALVLEAAGFTSVVDQRAGFAGAGGEPGWRPGGFPVSTEAEAGRSYEALAK